MSSEYRQADPERFSAEHSYSLAVTKIGLSIGTPIPDELDLTSNERFNVSTAGAAASDRFIATLDAYEFVVRAFPRWPRNLIKRVAAVAHGVSAGDVAPGEVAGLLTAIQADADPPK